MKIDTHHIHDRTIPVGMRLYVRSSQLCSDVPGTVEWVSNTMCKVKFDNDFTGIYSLSEIEYEEIK